VTNRKTFMAHSQSKPVTFGSPSFKVANFAGLQVSDIGFPAGLVLPAHTHEHAVFAVTIAGEWDSVMLNRPRDCRPGVVLTEPAGERHANHFGARGARVILIQADPAREELLRSCRQLLNEINLIPQPQVTALAWRIAAELAAPDKLSALAVEAASLEMFLVAARTIAPRRSAPVWLRRAKEMVHDRFRSEWSLHSFAAELGVHPAHLSRAFGREYGAPVGAYIRRLRMQWAAEQLAFTNAPISVIALEAGFTDQSHFTRAFVRFSGLTPAAYRREMRPGRHATS
jgi:AraC family transcriptional regulator